MQAASFVPNARVIGHDGRPIGRLMTTGERYEELVLGIMLDQSEQVVHVPCSQIDGSRSTRDAIVLPVLTERPSRIAAPLRVLRQLFSTVRAGHGSA